MRPPTDREKGLLIVCVFVLFAMANLVIGKRLYDSHQQNLEKLKVAEAEAAEQQKWLRAGDAWIQTNLWLDRNLPKLTSSSRAGSQLITELQDEAHERELRLERKNILPGKKTAFYEEVSVFLEIRGDLLEVQDWLTSMQRTDKFVVIKKLELELDTRSREKEPQARCNLELARWFSLEKAERDSADEDAENPETEPDPEAKPAPETETETESETESESDPDPEQPSEEDDPSSKLTAKP